MPERNTPHRVVVAGGGVAALETAIALRALAEERVDVELLAPSREFLYRPLAVAEPFGLGEASRFDLAGLAEGCGARHRLGSLRSVDVEAREVRTNSDAVVPYDTLVVACGAGPREAIRGALTFRGAQDVGAFRALLADAEAGELRGMAFAVPGGIAWALPLYELALMTAARLGDAGVDLTFVTPEATPLAVFGREGSDRVAEHLAARGIAFRGHTYPDAFTDGRLTVVPGSPVVADAVVALPRLAGAFVPGLPQDADGFLPVDGHGRVLGVEHVYAAGDITTFAVKQGGIAAQQADAVAEAIAASVGAPLEPRPFEPILRGLVLGGDGPTYLRAEISGGHGAAAAAGEERLWWPGAKVAARYLAPYLAERAGLAAERATR